MIAAPERSRLVRWWCVGLLLVVLIAAGAAAALFVPQERALRRVRENAREVEEQLQSLGLTSFKKAFSDLEAKVGAARAQLDNLELFRDEPGQDVVLDALALALSGGEVTLAELAPFVEKEPAKSTTVRRTPSGASVGGTPSPSPAPAPKTGPTGQGWRLRCVGSFAGMVALLHRMERHGVLFDVAEFEMEISEEGHCLKMGTVLRVYTPEALEPPRAPSTAGAAEPAAAPGATPKKRSTP